MKRSENNEPADEKPAAARRPTLRQIEEEIDRLESGRKMKKMLADTIKNLIVIAAASVVVANLLIGVLLVNRSSMAPTVSDGDVVIALRWVSVKPGDIIAFHYNNKVLLKRVIAKEGDLVDIDGDGMVYVNNEALSEPYLTEKSLGECDIGLPYVVPVGCVFVMGDHRETSADSRLREIGPVSSEYIVGKVIMRIWPLPKIGFPD
ncbi:MAG: signal peptidase I [Oscillospiraceae bacterium]|nr:signal peptidase I [Oscillospiraceae bacterium]